MTGDTTKLDPAFKGWLLELEHGTGLAINVTSGWRDPQHNQAVGGVNDSAHTEGLAADLEVRNGWERYQIVVWALMHGCKRVGVGKTFIHLDKSATHPSPVLWEYSK